MKQSLEEIKEYLKDKSICLIGNAESILKNKKDLSKFDIICRCNKGFPQGKEKFIGSRTDILFLNTKIEGAKIQLKFNPKFVVWLSINHSRASKWTENNAIEAPHEDWTELHDKFLTQITKIKKGAIKGRIARPTTGCLAFNFLIKHIQFKKLVLYGFDHFLKSGTWYNKTKKPHYVHDIEIEEKYMKKLIDKLSNVEIIIE